MRLIKDYFWSLQSFDTLLGVIIKILIMAYKDILEKNRTYVLERPVHNVTTFIYFDPASIIPDVFTQKFSDYLDEIRRMSNLVFIFNKKSEGIIDYRNVSTLYRACGYIVSDHDYLTQSLYYALSYFKILYERHTGYLVLADYEIEKIDLVKVKSIIYNGALQASIYEKERLSVDDLKEVFILPQKKKSFWSKFKCDIDLKYTSGMYSRYDTTIDNKGIFIRPMYIDELRKFLESPECPKYYLESFYTRFPTEFFASVGEYLSENVKILDLRIEKIDLK